MNEHLNAFTKLEFDKIRKHILRHALSDLGREHIANLMPSSALSEIRYNLSLVSEMKKLINEDEFLPLENIPDIRASAQRASIEDYVISAEELHSIASALQTGSKIHSYFARRRDLYLLLSKIVDAMDIDKVLVYNINSAIDEEGKVKDSASKTLASTRKQIADKKHSLRRSLERVLKEVSDKDWIQEEIITTREGRMVIPVKTEHKNRVPGFIHSASSSGATVFIEPTETLEQNNDICTLQFQEQREIQKILSELTRQVRESKDRILAAVSVLGKLDFVYAKAKYSTETIGNEPRMLDHGALRLLEARHPLLLQRHKREEVIPLDIEIGGDINTLIITGPNAGGKSVAMKTVGLLVLLAQAGCHIPASDRSEIRVFSDVFVDMGDEQSIENDLSSFSSHLSNLKVIIDLANASSLVLMDEIGSGTDPIEGASIAAATLEYVSAKDCITIATTHHGSLKAFAFETPHFMNGAMEFNQETLRPTYRFKAGIPGSSYAIEMAERLRMPEKLVERCKSLRGTEANKLDNLIIDLEKKVQELKNNLDLVSEEKKRYDTLNEEYQNKIASLQRELRHMKSQAVQEAADIVRTASSTIEKVVKEIKEGYAEKQIVKTARAEIKKIQHEFESLRSEIGDEDSPVVEFHIGDRVRLKSSTSVGEIVAHPDREHFVILIGALRVKAHKDELSRTKDESMTPIHPMQQFERTTTVKREIDLRGMYAQDAISAVEKFLDEAVLSGLDRVSLIHGKGTGALRRKINEHLKEISSIKSFRLGEWNEGGTGVTVVELQGQA